VGSKDGKIYIEGVVSLSTYDKPLIADVDEVGLERIKNMLQHKISANYADKMKLELVLYLIKTLNGNKIE